MNLTEREWTVLDVLWKHGGTDLGTMVKELEPHTGWNRNTVLTYLTRMEKKGLVCIHKEVRPHVYEACMDKDACQKEERQSFLHRVYHGAAADMITAFLKEEKLTKEEKEQLQKMLDEMEV